MPDKDCYELGIKGFDKTYFNTHDIEQEYMYFSCFIQGIFISKNG